jgi:hypothetical protein
MTLRPFLRVVAYRELRAVWCRCSGLLNRGDRGVACPLCRLETLLGHVEVLLELRS